MTRQGAPSTLPGDKAGRAEYVGPHDGSYLAPPVQCRVDDDVITMSCKNDKI